MGNWKCNLFGHKFCKCGWCKQHKICLRCYWDNSCLKYHPDLLRGMLCQASSYELLEVRGVLEN